MKYLLDTSVIVDMLRKRKEAIQFITSHKEDAILTSSICEEEILVWVYLSQEKFRSERKQEHMELFDSFHEIVEVDREQADIAAEIKAELLKAGNIIDDLDILIAAAAIASHATLITRNIKHFIRISNLKVESLQE